MSVRTGKTKVIIDITRARWKLGQIQALVIFAPKSVREVWAEEFEKHAPDVPIHVMYSGEPPTVPRMGRILPVYIQSLEGVSGSKKQRDFLRGFLTPSGQVMMVCDESHKIKTPNTTRTKNILEFSKKAVYKYILTGTELDKGIQDLWSQFSFLSPSILGSPNFWSFRNRYCLMGGFNAKQIVGWQNVPEFENKVRPHMFRADKDVLGVPETVYTSRWVDPSPEQLALAKKIVDGEYEAAPEHVSRRELGEMVQLPNRFAPHLITLTKHLRVQQVAGGDLTPGSGEAGNMLVGGPKLLELRELLEEHKNDKVVIWARFTQEIEQISAMLRGCEIPHVTFTGSVDPSERVAARQYFQSDKVDVFVCNVQTGGTGLALYSQDLTRQHVLIYYSNSFSYIDRVQSEARTIAAGQQHGTVVYDIYMRGLKIEKLIQKALAAKKSLYDIVVQGLATPD
jgi:SNF2 family DNA or RNA helicase